MSHQNHVSIIPPLMRTYVANNVISCNPNQQQHVSLLLTGGSAGIVRLWNYETSELLAAHGGHSSTINAIAFSPDDKQIVSVAEDGSIILWCVFSVETQGENDGRPPPVGISTLAAPLAHTQHSWGMKSSVHT